MKMSRCLCAGCMNAYLGTCLSFPFVGVVGLIIIRKSEEKLDCGIHLCEVLALAEETWAFSERAQATCDDFVMLPGAGCRMFSVLLPSSSLQKSSGFLVHCGVFPMPCILKI